MITNAHVLLRGTDSERAVLLDKLAAWEREVSDILAVYRTEVSSEVASSVLQWIFLLSEYEEEE